MAETPGLLGSWELANTSVGFISRDPARFSQRRGEKSLTGSARRRGRITIVKCRMCSP